MINENQKKMAMKILIHEQLKAMHSTIFILEIFLNNLQTAIPKIASIEYFEITLTMLEIIEEIGEVLWFVLCHKCYYCKPVFFHSWQKKIRKVWEKNYDVRVMTT